MTNLIKEWRRIKHSPQYEGRDDRRFALCAIMIERSRTSSPVGKKQMHINVGIKRVIRHGVSLANVPDDFFDAFHGAWSNRPGTYHFLSTAKRWLEVMHSLPTTDICNHGDLKPYLDQLGYVLTGGNIVAKRNLVKGYGGVYINTQYATLTFVGWASPTYRVEIAALPKQHQAAARKWVVAHPDAEGCVVAPLELVDPSKLNYESGVWRKPAPPKPFVITRIGNYHSSAKHLRSLDHLAKGIRIGLEVELACPYPRRGSAVAISAAKFLNKHVHSRYTLVEQDRSVDNGFELVIAPASVDFHKRKLLALADTWRRLGEKSNPFKRCNDADRSAGIHIHVDKRSVRNWAALSHFVCIKKLPEDYSDTWRKALFGRTDGYYCQEYTDKTEPHSKYSAINATHGATYEARCFSSSNDPKEWVAHIEVLEAMVAWTNGMLMFNPKRLTVSEFLKFLFAHSEEYPLAYARGFALHRQVTLERLAKADKDDAVLESLEAGHA